jgi:acetyl-CoA carboxylase carboxyl transferase subunit alpha
LGGAHQDVAQAAATLKEALKRNFGELKGLSLKALLDGRYKKFRAMGVWEDLV